MERGCITYSAFYLAGIFSCIFTVLPFPLHATVSAILLALCFITKRNAIMFLTFSHLALFIAGAGAMSLNKSGSNLPPDKFTTYISDAAANAKGQAASYLEQFTYTENAHATLCALTVGKKDSMEPSLRKAYSDAGAIHVLALSGLHTGIVYSILETVLLPLCILPGGHIARLAICILFLAAFVVISGCSPSVIRAAIMIFIYKIAKASFRNTGKWDAIALAALVTGIIAPAQANSIGFQLSYSAVAGILLLHPVCKEAFIKIAASILNPKGIIYMASLKVWECISISVCCQIATIPFLLHYFGAIPQYFLISNIAAIPLATAILYSLGAVLILQPFPGLDTISVELLNLLIETLNRAMVFIGT